MRRLRRDEKEAVMLKEGLKDTTRRRLESIPVPRGQDI